MALRSLRATALAAAVTAACGGGGMTTAANMTGGSAGGGTTTTGNTAMVNVQDYSFSPSTLTVKVGTQLTFTNYGAAIHHPVADNGAWDAGDLGPAQSGAYGMGNGVGGMATLTLGATGTVSFHCTIHPSMTGTITVTE